MRKRLLALLLSAAMVASLTSCGQSKEGSVDIGTGSTTEEKSENEEVTLSAFIMQSTTGEIKKKEKRGKF